MTPSPILVTAAPTVGEDTPMPSAGPVNTPSPVTATTSSTHTSSGPTTTTNAQLARMLSEALQETDGLKRELLITNQRLEKSERLLAAYTSSNGNNTQTQAQLDGIITEYDARLTATEHQRDEAEARRRILSDTWQQLDRYLQVVEVRAADARNGFNRIVQEGGGQLILSSIPLPSNSVMPPPASHSRNMHTSKNSRQQQQPPFPANLPLPPPPNAHPNLSPQSAHKTRPRAGSLDEAGYLHGQGQPPAKRSRGERDRGYSESEYQNGQLVRRSPQYTSFPSGQQHYSRPSSSSHRPVSAHSSHGQFSHHVSPRSGSRSRSRSRSRSHSRSSSVGSRASLDVDEMLLQTTNNTIGNPPPPRQRHRGAGYESARYSQPSQSPEFSRPNSSHRPNGATQSQPQAQQIQLQTYQTHVFAPVVTGAPVKKTKYTPGVNTAPATGDRNNTPNTAGNPAIVYPATNAEGQRICRQCGMAGRYKENKCVEKWGPGPMGPGTVCDRCRKKMKRVERRGTLESQPSAHAMPSLGQTSSAIQSQTPVVVQTTRGLQRSDTVLHQVPAPSQQQQPRTVRSPRGPLLATEEHNIAHVERRNHEIVSSQQASSHGNTVMNSNIPLAAVSNTAPPRHQSRPASRNGQARNAGLQDVLTAAKSNGANEGPMRQTGDDDGEGDADGEAELDDIEQDSALHPANNNNNHPPPRKAEEQSDADGDPDTELLEAVDAAEANSTGTGSQNGGWTAKVEEDMDV